MRVSSAARRYSFGLIVLAGACAAGATGTPDGKPALDAEIRACGACHGADGNSTREGVPSLAGQPEKFLTDQLILIREGVRRSELMRPFVRGLDDTTIVAIAKYFAAKPVRPPDEPVDPELAARGRALAEQGHCGGCHLKDFSGRAQIPRIAGQREDYLVATLRAYRNGKALRPDTTMNNIMRGASDGEIRALAHYLTHAARE